MKQLTRLAKPFDPKWIKQLPGKEGADFVEHGIVRQQLIGILGRVPTTQILREIYDGDKVTGVLMRMTLIIDGNESIIEEFGAADNPQDKTNGDRAKTASSDAYKRCAMAASKGLHLWCSDYFLYDALVKQETPEQSKSEGAAAAPSPTGSGSTPPTQASLPVVDPSGTVANQRYVRIIRLAADVGMDEAQLTEFARTHGLLGPELPLMALMETSHVVSSGKLTARLEAMKKNQESKK